jgi:chitinase
LVYCFIILERTFIDGVIANACGEDFYAYPNGTKSGLRSNCPGIGPGIKKCQANGKKVLLSVGGGWPTNYYLPSKAVAEYFAEFLYGAFGPQTQAWVDAKKPRPFGDAAVDGFDLDLEAYMEPAPMDGYLYKYYDNFVTHLRSQGSVLISGAPQCVSPDARKSDCVRLLVQSEERLTSHRFGRRHLCLAL